MAEFLAVGPSLGTILLTTFVLGDVAALYALSGKPAGQADTMDEKSTRLLAKVKRAVDEALAKFPGAAPAAAAPATPQPAVSSAIPKSTVVTVDAALDGVERSEVKLNKILAAVNEAIARLGETPAPAEPPPEGTDSNPSGKKEEVPPVPMKLGVATPIFKDAIDVAIQTGGDVAPIESLIKKCPELVLQVWGPDKQSTLMFIVWTAIERAKVDKGIPLPSGFMKKFRSALGSPGKYTRRLLGSIADGILSTRTWFISERKGVSKRRAMQGGFTGPAAAAANADLGPKAIAAQEAFARVVKTCLYTQPKDETPPPNLAFKLLMELKSDPALKYDDSVPELLVPVVNSFLWWRWHVLNAPRLYSGAVAVDAEGLFERVAPGTQIPQPFMKFLILRSLQATLGEPRATSGDTAAIEALFGHLRDDDTQFSLAKQEGLILEFLKTDEGAKQVNFIDSESGMTLLMHAAKGVMVKAVNKLMDMDADIGKQDKLGNTVFHYIADTQRSRSEYIKSLLAKASAADLAETTEVVNEIKSRRLTPAAAAAKSAAAKAAEEDAYLKDPRLTPEAKAAYLAAKPKGGRTRRRKQPKNRTRRGGAFFDTERVTIAKRLLKYQDKDEIETILARENASGQLAVEISKVKDGFLDTSISVYKLIEPLTPAKRKKFTPPSEAGIGSVALSKQLFGKPTQPVPQPSLPIPLPTTPPPPQTEYEEQLAKRQQVANKLGRRLDDIRFPAVAPAPPPARVVPPPPSELGTYVPPAVPLRSLWPPPPAVQLYSPLPPRPPPTTPYPFGPQDAALAAAAAPPSAQPLTSDPFALPRVEVSGFPSVFPGPAAPLLPAPAAPLLPAPAAPLLPAPAAPLLPPPAAPLLPAPAAPLLPPPAAPAAAAAPPLSQNSITLDEKTFEFLQRWKENDRDYVDVKVDGVDHSMYRSLSNNGFWRHCTVDTPSTGHIYKGKDYVMTTLIDFRLQKFINSIVDKLREVDGMCNYTQTKNNTNHPGAAGVAESIEPFATFATDLPCGDDNKAATNEEISEALVEFMGKVKTTYNFGSYETVDPNFSFGRAIEEANWTLNSEILRRELTPKTGSTSNPVWLYVMHIRDMTLTSKMLSTPITLTDYYVPIAVIPVGGDTITKFGTYAKYVPSGVFVCKLLEYIIQSHRTSQAVSKSYAYVGDRYKDIQGDLRPSAPLAPSAAAEADVAARVSAEAAARNAAAAQAAPVAPAGPNFANEAAAMAAQAAAKQAAGPASPFVLEPGSPEATERLRVLNLGNPSYKGTPTEYDKTILYNKLIAKGKVGELDEPERRALGRINKALNNPFVENPRGLPPSTRGYGGKRRHKTPKRPKRHQGGRARKSTFRRRRKH